MRKPQYEFLLSLDSFISGPKSKKPAPYNWTDDGCSAPWWTLSQYWSGKFNRACVRHDFGYRNYGSKSKLKIGRSNYVHSRQKIDDQFLKDMYHIAAGADGVKAAAYGYYWAVRSKGAGAFGEG